MRQARKQKNFTQTQVARQLNKRQPDYSEYERGIIQLDYEKIVLLCQLLEITPNDLFGFDDK